MEKLTYQLEAFEGPLDLLLYLIRKNKLNICDIPIAEVLDQYMAQINAAKAENMDVASEFLEMATRLVYIKTVYLLPKHEEADQMKAELSGQLLEYEECKRVAALLKEKFQMDYFVRVPEEIEPDYTYRRHHLPEELYNAYVNTLGKSKFLRNLLKKAFLELFLIESFLSLHRSFLSCAVFGKSLKCLIGNFSFTKMIVQNWLQLFWRYWNLFGENEFGWMEIIILRK